MLYRHLRTNAVAELIEKKELTVILKDLETSAEKEVSVATLKRWWKAVSEEALPMAEFESPDNPPEALTAAYEPEPIPERSTGAQNEPNESKADNCEPETQNTTTEVQGSHDDSIPLALSEIVSKLENLFDLLNKLYFESTLPGPVITIQSTPKAYGHCSTKKIWKGGDEDDGYYELNIGAEYLNRSSENTAATMLHEMIHLYCRENGLDETCQNGRYHNKLFKAQAEKRDLNIDYNRTIGYSSTSPTEAFTEKLQKAGFVLEIPFARHTFEVVKKKSDRVKAHKYYCAVCGQEVRTTAELNLICGTCEIPMGRAD